MPRYLPFLLCALLAGCSSDSNEPKDAGPDGTPGDPTFCDVLSAEPVAVTVTGTTPWASGPDLGTACLSAIGWGSCEGGTIWLTLADGEDAGGAPFSVEAEVSFDGTADASDLARDCALHVPDVDTPLPCSFVGSFDLTGGTSCPGGGGPGARIQGALSVSAAGYDLASTIDITSCAYQVCI